MVKQKTDIITISTKLNQKIWNDLKSKVKSNIDEIALFELLQRYRKYETLLNKNKITFDVYKKKLLFLKNLSIRYENEIESLKNELNDSDLQIEALEKKVKYLLSENSELKNNPILNEKIVYREDTKLINDLKMKADNLQSKIWQKDANFQKYKEDYVHLKKELDEIKIKKDNRTALLILIKSSADGQIHHLNYEWLKRGEFNKLHRDIKEFCKYKQISSPAYVINVWDEPFSEQSVFKLNTGHSAFKENDLKR